MATEYTMEREKYIKKIIDDGEEIDMCKKKELADLFNCSVSNINGVIYRIRNPFYYKNKKKPAQVIAQNSRAKRLNISGVLLEEDWIALCNKYDNVCVKCKRALPLVIDHVVALARGGTNTIDNIQPLCRDCNCSKNHRYADYRLSLQGEGIDESTKTNS